MYKMPFSPSAKPTSAEFRSDTPPSTVSKRTTFDTQTLSGFLAAIVYKVAIICSVASLGSAAILDFTGQLQSRFYGWVLLLCLSVMLWLFGRYFKQWFVGR